jgi:hypothetical protein
MHYRSLNDPSKPPYDFGIAKAIRPAVALALHAGQNGYGNYEWKLGYGRAFPEPGRFIREVRTMLLLREYVRRSLPENLAGTAFGLFVAGLVVWLVVLYWSAPFDL